MDKPECPRSHAECSYVPDSTCHGYPKDHPLACVSLETCSHAGTKVTFHEKLTPVIVTKATFHV